MQQQAPSELGKLPEITLHMSCIQTTTLALHVVRTSKSHHIILNPIARQECPVLTEPWN